MILDIVLTALLLPPVAYFYYRVASYLIKKV